MSTIAERDALTGVSECDLVNIEDRELHMFYRGKWIVAEMKIDRE